MPRRRFLPVLVLLFVGSGCAALIYEIVWFQLLELVIGSSAVSMGVLLGTFMGGMCLGSLLIPRVVPARYHPLRVYAALELGIAALGLAVLIVVPHIGGIYAAWAGPGASGLVLRIAAVVVCLVPPTLLMGATLPAVSRWVETTPQGVSWLGFFYGGNLAGAVIGSLVSGFYLLAVYDTTVATLVAVRLNATVAAIAFGVALVTAHKMPSPSPAQVGVSAPAAQPVYVAIALSGMTALAAEVVWTRLLSLLFGATVYTFSLILAVFLVGLGIGSSAGSLIAKSVVRPRLVLASCQLLLCAAIAWTSYMLTDSLPYWPVNPALAPSPSYTMQLDLVRCLWAVLPAPVLWGASFPLALASITGRGQDAGRLVGRVYAANTAGAIVGSLGASLALVAWIGSQRTEQGLMMACFAAGALAMVSQLALEPAPSGARWAVAATLILAALLTAPLIATVHPVPGALVAYGRYTVSRSGDAEMLYVGEGVTASVAVSRLRGTGVLNYHNAGKVQASSQPQDMRIERMLGHIPILVSPRPRSVLVIGCGAGVTAGAVAIDPAVERVTIVEIEPLVPKVVSTYFKQLNFDVVHNPKVQIAIDDGRHYVLTTKERFDVVTSDPLDPWVKGTAMLYTREFFALVKRHLNPEGVVTLWVPLYESNVEAVKSQLATFFEAFPNGLIFGNTHKDAGYDLLLLGQVEPTRIDVDAIDRRLRQPEYADVERSLGEAGFSSALALFSTYAGRAFDLRPWLLDAVINEDRNLKVQYLAGLGLNLDRSTRIYADILHYRRYVDGLFLGSSDTQGTIWKNIEARP
jgi:spermidine synthase